MRKFVVIASIREIQEGLQKEKEKIQKEFPLFDKRNMSIFLEGFVFLSYHEPMGAEDAVRRSYEESESLILLDLERQKTTLIKGDDVERAKELWLFYCIKNKISLLETQFNDRREDWKKKLARMND